MEALKDGETLNEFGVRRFNEGFKLAKEGTCMSCKFMAQGKTCCFCAHPTPVGDYGKYVYYNFICFQHDRGHHESRIK
jgi:hypothetical protein